MQRRVIAVFLLFCLSCGMMCVRIYTFMASDIAASHTMNHNKKIVIDTLRFPFYDCNSEPLVNNEFKFFAAFKPDSEVADKLCGFTDRKELEKIMTAIKNRTPSYCAVDKPVQNDEYIVCLKKYVRYSDSQPAVHLLGYINGDGAGVSGLEKAFDSFLVSDTQLYASFPCDASGRVIHGAEIITDSEYLTSKGGVYLTVDKRIQQIVQEELNASTIKKGAVLVCGTKTGEIKIIKYLQDNIAGTVAFAKVPREALGMTAPMNKYEPYMYLNCEIRDSEVNYPIVCFTRKPGMIVSYKNVGAWVSSITPTAKDSYIIGIFVLNSWNEMKNSPTPKSLEEYVRKSEMADHTSWSDWSEGTYNPRIITKIQNGVNRLISREFAPENRGPAPKEKSGLGKFLGDMILPPEGFGRLAESEKDKKSPSAGAANKGRRFRVENDRIRYFAESMIVPVIIDSGTKNKLSRVSFEIQVDSEVKRMSIGEWEQKMGLQTPFALKNCRIDIETIDGKKVGVYDTFSENEMKKEMQ